LLDGGAPGVFAGGAERLFDAQQLVVLRDAIAAAGGPGLDLSDAGRDREVLIVVSSVSLTDAR
jgi:hypothetical protein